MPQHPSIGPISNFLMGRPIAAPADAVRTNNPNAPVTPGRQMTGMPGAITRGIIAPVMNHPLTSALAGIAAPAAVGAGAAAAPALMAPAAVAATKAEASEDPLSSFLSTLGRGGSTSVSPEYERRAASSLIDLLPPQKQALMALNPMDAAR